MKEYMVRISEIRYEFIEAKSPSDAIKKAEKMTVTNADEIKCEIISEVSV